MKKGLALSIFLGLPALVLAQEISVSPGVKVGNGPAVQAQAPSMPPPTPTVNPAVAPKIVFPRPNFDFGNVDEGPDIVHEFHFRNRGKTTLKINNVSTSCGCTAAVEDKKEIPAGGRGTIKATYHTSGRPGHATKFITVSSNDPANPNFQLKLDMTVVRDVDVMPDRLYLYGVRHGTTKDNPVTLLGKPGAPLHILSAQSTNGSVTVIGITPIPKTADNRSGAVVQVRLPDTQAIGSLNDNVVIKTDNPKKPEVDLQVLGEITGRVQVNPRSLYFAPHQDQPVTVTLSTADRPESFIVRSVSSAKGLVRPYVKRINNNGQDQYLLIVSVLKNLPKDSDGKDQVIVNTNDSEQPKITLDVQASK